MIIQIDPTDIYFAKEIQEMCLRKGGSFPKGCPNYRKKQGCPPNQPLIDEIFDFQKPLYLIYTEFNVKKFADKMRKKHPKWTERQCYNSRYWQSTARKEHKKELERFLNQYPKTMINTSPEANGVNLHSLMLKATGIKLEWPPRKISRIVSFGAYKK
jgi:predicted metal-binding protein